MAQRKYKSPFGVFIKEVKWERFAHSGSGHDEDFVPQVTPDFKPTDAPAGSLAKLKVLAERVRMGFPLWHEDDLSDYSGLTGYRTSDDR